MLPSGVVVPEDIAIRKSDLTEEGFEFYKRVEQKWLGAIDRGKSPSDTSILEKELAMMRQDS